LTLDTPISSAPDYTFSAAASYALLGFRVDFVASVDSRWRLSVDGTNVLDKYVQLQRFGYFGDFGIDRVTPGRPPGPPGPPECGAEVALKF
jgi:iron complex outermembrane receptor protein